jgi:hypothetical protein
LWLVNPSGHLAFGKLVEDASHFSAVVKANAVDLKQFAKLRNAIVHDAGYAHGDHICFRCPCFLRTNSAECGKWSGILWLSCNPILKLHSSGWHQKSANVLTAKPVIQYSFYLNIE